MAHLTLCTQLLSPALGQQSSIRLLENGEMLRIHNLTTVSDQRQVRIPQLLRELSQNLCSPLAKHPVLAEKPWFGPNYSALHAHWSSDSNMEQNIDVKLALYFLSLPSNAKIGAVQVQQEPVPHAVP